MWEVLDIIEESDLLKKIKYLINNLSLWEISKVICLKWGENIEITEKEPKWWIPIWKCANHSGIKKVYDFLHKEKTGRFYLKRSLNYIEIYKIKEEEDISVWVVSRCKNVLTPK